jgi:hypothetical protein
LIGPINMMVVPQVLVHSNMIHSKAVLNPASAKGHAGSMAGQKFIS